MEGVWVVRWGGVWFVRWGRSVHVGGGEGVGEVGLNKQCIYQKLKNETRYLWIHA